MGKIPCGITETYTIIHKILEEILLFYMFFFHGGFLQQSSRRALAQVNSKVDMPKEEVKITSMVMIYSQRNIFSNLGKKMHRKTINPECE